MALDREAIFVALERRITDRVTTANYVTRRAIDCEQIRPDRMPSIEIISHAQRPLERSLGDPPVWMLDVALVVMARNSATDPSVTAETLLNRIVYEVEAALEPQPGESPEKWGTTLGGLVYSAFPDGAIEYWQGEKGGQSVATIPVQLVVGIEAI